MSGLFSGPWLTDWLVDTGAAVTLLIALVLVVRGPVARVFGPTFAYALWLLPLARAVLPGITLTVEAPASPAVAIPLALAAPPPMPVAPAFDLGPLLILIWLTGAIFLGGHALLAYVRLRRAIAADTSLIDIRGRIAIMQSGAVDGPVALGLIRPLVVLPRDFNAIFTPLQQRQVIAHELQHHRGGDLAINLAAFALLALNWFNPIVWAGWRAFRQDQEAACDARTLDRLGARTGADRATYGRAIAVAVAGPVFRPTPAFALSMGEKSALIHRLRSLTMTDITPRRRWLGRTALTAAALIALPVTASVSYAVVQTEPPATPAPPAAPGAPHVIISSEDAPHERRIEQNGRTIILRTTQPLSDAEVERMVAEAETTAGGENVGADAGQRRTVHRIVIRNQGEGGAAMPVPPVPPIPPVPPADGGTRSQSVFVYGNGTAAVYGQGPDHCGAGNPQQATERVVGEAEGRHTIRVISCGPRNLHVTALRSARASMAAMTADQLPAAARTQALAEIDRAIAEREREGAN